MRGIKTVMALLMSAVLCVSVSACVSSTAGAASSSSSADPAVKTQSLSSILGEVEDKYSQGVYKDSRTNLSVPYNLYLPDNYSKAKKYPLVVFIADASVTGRNVKKSLTQGYGGVIWASKQVQSKHKCIVLVPQYPSTVLDDHGSYTTTPYLELTRRMIESISSKYAVDKNRIYGTGQSMGCMITMVLAAEHPHLYAACLLVDGQWKPETLKPLADQKFFYFAAGGDNRALGGMQDLIPVLKKAGADIVTAEWNAKWPASRLESAAKKVISRGSTTNCITWKKGTVLPADASSGSNEHMYSFDYPYKIAAVRDWLFSQSNSGK